MKFIVEVEVPIGDPEDLKVIETIVRDRVTTEFGQVGVKAHIPRSEVWAMEERNRPQYPFNRAILSPLETD